TAHFFKEVGRSIYLGIHFLRGVQPLIIISMPSVLAGRESSIRRNNLLAHHVCKVHMDREYDVCIHRLDVCSFFAICFGGVVSVSLRQYHPTKLMLKKKVLNQKCCCQLMPLITDPQPQGSFSHAPSKARPM